jgi:hypothetical protein
VQKAETETAMSGDAKMTMLLYTSLSSDEQGKLELLDNAVSAVLIGAGITDRAMWTGATESAGRVVRLCTDKRVMLEIEPGELATMPVETVLSRLHTAVNRTG